ncbi:hypothetical protein Tco_0287779 [Tanacetum coccineum]
MDESAPIPQSPQTKVPFAQTHLRRARKTVRLKPPMSPSMEARIAEYAAAPTPPSPPPSPLSPWYEVGESSTAAPRPTGDLAEAVEEDRQTQLFQRVDGLVKDRQFHYETARLLDQEALASREAWAHSVGLSSAVSLQQGQLSTALGQIQALQARDQTHTDDPKGTASTANNMPPRRSFATARAAAAAARAATTAVAAAAPMTAAAVEQLIEARVSAALVNHETLQNNTNGHGDGSHNSGIRTKIS